MAYYYPNDPQNGSANLDDVKNVGRAGLAGLFQGLSGENMTYEQWLKERKMKARGYPSKRPNWLQRLLN